jgi:hypothetical protein
MIARRPLVLLGAALMLVAPAWAAASDDAPRSSPNLELVATIPGGGTDLEFFSRTLATYKAADGTMVTPLEPVERHFSLVGSPGLGPRIVDITSPEQPYVASAVPNCKINQGDVQVTKDGMVAAIAKQGSGTCRTVTGKTLANGSAIVDLSDVYNPQVVGLAPESSGSHNNTIHPSGDYLYISTSNTTPDSGTNGEVPIYDISNPAAPQLVKTWTTPGNPPHDIRFSDDGARAYMAGISQYRIVDTSDPVNPKLISTIVPPGGTIGHDTLVTRDKAFLFLGDEAGGGAPYPCPGGAIYVYDIRNEASPAFLGAAEAGGGPVIGRNLGEVPGPTRVGGCTSHVMELNPDGKSLTLGWYVLGSRTFSFAGLYNPDGTPKPGPALSWGSNGVGLVETGFMIPTDTASTWAAKQYAKVPGYIFSNDGSAGFYVTKIKSA